MGQGFDRLCKQLENTWLKNDFPFDFFKQAALFEINDDDVIAKFEKQEIKTIQNIEKEYLNNPIEHQPFPKTIVETSLYVPEYDTMGTMTTFTIQDSQTKYKFNNDFTLFGFSISRIGRVKDIYTVIIGYKYKDDLIHGDEEVIVLENDTSRYVNIQQETELQYPVEVALHRHAYSCDLLMEPSHFIVETTSKNPQHRSFKKIPRSHQRPCYTYLKLEEIKKRYNLTGGHGTSLVTGHPRRRHKRTYRNDRYTHMKGKTVDIPAVWVGPKETTIGNKIYRVCIDH